MEMKASTKIVPGDIVKGHRVVSVKDGGNIPFPHVIIETTDEILGFAKDEAVRYEKGPTVSQRRMKLASVAWREANRSSGLFGTYVNGELRFA